ncbi:MAG: 23S rRNA (uracil(1939)-C(5))-methyltransferase RlmD [Chlorobiota bacterium]
MSKKKKKNIELKIESIGFEGKAIARHNDKVHFIKKVVPGDLVEAYVKRKRKSYNEAGLVRVIEESENRVEPRCDYFDDCGGCSWQNMPYSDQLAWKKQHVIDAFERIGKIETEVFDVLPSPQDFYYRNKMDFTFSAKRWVTRKEIETENEIDNKEFALGLHSPGSFEKALDIKKCHIHPETGNEILSIVRNFALENEITAFDKRDKTGYLRELITRYSGSSNSIMIILTTNASDEHHDTLVNELATLINDKINDKINFIHAINSGPSPVAIESSRLVLGKEYLIDKILGVDFKVSPFSFFQTNRVQLNNFVCKILESVPLNDDMTVWDLYCGTGSIALPAAKKVKKVYGLELVESAISDAKQNALINGLDNTDFQVADLHAKQTPELLDKLPKPDLIFIDPPRAGMHTNLVNHLLEINAPKLVYVSCNPSTQARDCELLKQGYKVISVQPVDMFPQTYHIESIAILERI